MRDETKRATSKRYDDAEILLSCEVKAKQPVLSQQLFQQPVLVSEPS